MKKRIIGCLLLLPIVCFAQRPKDEYNIVTTDDLLSSFYGKKFPGYYITNDNNRVDCLILFETGDKMSDHTGTLITSMAYNGEEKTISKNQLKVFFVNDRLYAPVQIDGVTMWGNYTLQGAIHLVNIPVYIKARIEKGIEAYYDEKRETNVLYTDTITLYKAYWSEVQYTQKLSEQAMVYPMVSRKNLVKLVSDNANLATKIDNKEKGYKAGLVLVPGAPSFAERMFTIYNQWYDEQNPTAITYFDERATYSASDKPGTAANAHASSNMSASQKAYFAPRIDRFKGRPTAASQDIASTKPEVAVKKESFADRLSRLKADGNKVGVLVTSKNLAINPETFGEDISPANVKGFGDPMSELDIVAEATATEFNAGFGTDIFEAVDYTKIPYKEVKYGKIDDWWSTKYKMIVLYELEPSYSAFYRTNSSTGEREFVAYKKVNTELIIMAAEDAKPDRLRYVLNSPRRMGSYKSEEFIGPEDADINIIQELTEAIDPPDDASIVAELIMKQKEPLAKLIKKKSN